MRREHPAYRPVAGVGRRGPDRLALSVATTMSASGFHPDRVLLAQLVGVWQPDGSVLHPTVTRVGKFWLATVIAQTALRASANFTTAGVPGCRRPVPRCG